MSLILRHLLANKYRLPQAYIPLAYVQSTGTQRLIIPKNSLSGNIKVNTTSVMYADIRSESNANLCMLSCRGTNGISLWNDGHMQFMANSTQNATVRDMLLNNRTIVKISGSSSTGRISVSGYDDVTFTGGTGGEEQADICLFHANGETGRLGIMKLYYFKLITNNVVQAELVPAMQRSDGSVGVYNFVNNTFYTTAAGTLKPGPEVVMIPDAYQQVEYLESVANAHINTTFKYNAKMNIEMKAKLRQTLNISGQSYMYLFGAVIGNYRGCIRTEVSPTAKTCLQTSATSTTAFQSLSLFSQNDLVASSTYGDNFHMIKVCQGSSASKTKVMFDGTSSSSEADRTDDTEINCTVAIFAQHNNNNFNFRNPGVMIEYIKTSQGSSSTLTHHLVPCYRKSDGVIGFYDNVTDEFFQETVTDGINFILGPTVIQNTWATELNQTGTNNSAIVRNSYYDADKPKAHAQGSAVFLGNANSYMKLNLPSVSGTAFSACCWVYISTTSQKQVYFAIKNTKTTLGLLAEGLLLGSADTKTVPQVVNITNNAWNHLVVTRSGSTYKLYANGVAGTDSTTAATQWTTAAGDAYIAKRGSGNDSFSGKMYDFRLYNHTLTQEEVEQIYNEG